MASAKPLNCVMHCTSTQYNKVSALGTNLINGLYANTTLFPNPPVKLADTGTAPNIVLGFQSQLTELKDLIVSAKGNTDDKNLRNAQSKLVHGMEVQLLAYANPICNHILANIQLSGFDSNKTPQPTVKPLAPLIKKITEDKQETGYWKATIEKPKTGGGMLTERVAAALHKGTRWTVKSSTTAAGPYTILLQDAASTKLVFTGLTVGVKNYILIYGTNAKGKGPDSKPFPFTPQIP
ncbi:MAG: hypothetical protein ACHQII_03880 [Bacteroidia bacterium]